MQSVLQDWVMALPLRHQGVLIGAVRGCDGIPKDHCSKPIIRALRRAFLNPADERECSAPNAFMSPNMTMSQIDQFTGNMDELPLHFVTHMMLGAQVIAYKSPQATDRGRFLYLYYKMVSAMHLLSEPEADMDARLIADRMSTGKYINP